MTTGTKSLEAQSAAAAEAVGRARSALGHACRWDGSASAIASAREALRIAKIERLKADLALLEADPVAARSRVVVVADGDPDVRPSADLHAALDLAQRDAIRSFFESHPRPRVEDFEPDPWTADVHRAYQAITAAFVQSHIALGCDVNSACRVDAR